MVCVRVWCARLPDELQAWLNGAWLRGGVTVGLAERRQRRGQETAIPPWCGGSRPEGLAKVGTHAGPAALASEHEQECGRRGSAPHPHPHRTPPHLTPSHRPFPRQVLPVAVYYKRQGFPLKKIVQYAKNRCGGGAGRHRGHGVGWAGRAGVGLERVGAEGEWVVRSGVVCARAMLCKSHAGGAC